MEINLYAMHFFHTAELQADTYYGDNGEMKDKYISLVYGDSLLKYINDKNLRNIQLSKKRYKND